MLPCFLMDGMLQYMMVPTAPQPPPPINPLYVYGPLSSLCLPLNPWGEGGRDCTDLNKNVWAGCVSCSIVSLGNLLTMSTPFHITYSTYTRSFIMLIQNVVCIELPGLIFSSSWLHFFSYLTPHPPFTAPLLLQ